MTISLDVMSPSLFIPCIAFVVDRNLGLVLYNVRRLLVSMRPSARLLLASPSSTGNAVRTSSTRSGRRPPPLSLEHFIQRQRVLGLWRTILRSLYKIPKDTRGEPIAYARGEFERNKHVSDVSQIRYLISTGKVEFDSMQRYIDELASRGR